MLRTAVAGFLVVAVLLVTGEATALQDAQATPDPAIQQDPAAEPPATPKPLEPAPPEPEPAPATEPVPAPVSATLLPETAVPAEFNQELKVRLERLTVLGTEADAAHIAVRESLNALRSQVRSVRSRVEVAGVTPAVGLYLVRRRAELGDVRDHITALDARQSVLAEIQVRRIEIDEALAELRISPRRFDGGTGLSEVLREKRRLLEQLFVAERVHFQKLLDLDIDERRLVDETEALADYIDRRALWLRTGAPLHDNIPELLRDTAASFAWFTDGEAWEVVSAKARRRLLPPPVGIGLGLLATLILWLGRPRHRRALVQTAVSARHIRTDGFALTVSALTRTALLAVPGPLLVWTLAHALAESAAGTPQALALAEGLRTVAQLWILLAFARAICLPDGLGGAHFRWHQPGLDLLRQNLRWLTAALLPAAFVGGAVAWTRDEGQAASLARLTFMAAHLVVALFVVRTFAPQRALIGGIIEADSDGLTARLRWLWWPLAVALPLFLLVLSALGWVYTANELHQRCEISGLIFLGALFVHALSLRGLYAARRRHAWEQVTKRAAVRKDKEESSQETKAGGASSAATATGAGAHDPRSVDARLPEDDVDLDFEESTQQSRRLIASSLIIGLLVGWWWTWADITPALSALESVTLWTDSAAAEAAAGPAPLSFSASTPSPSSGVTPAEGGAAAGGNGAGGGLLPFSAFPSLSPPPEATDTSPGRVTLVDLLGALVALALTLVAARNVPGLLEIAVLRRLRLDTPVRYATATIARYLIIVVGIAIAFGTLGVGWSKVQWLAAAVTVGLGFGLQEIFANFVSGLILLVEQPVRVGDTVTVAQVSGRVSRIRTRATTIRTWDRKELIVPNKDFVTGHLVNWSLSDAVLRVAIPIGIAYGSDTEKAEEALVRVARSVSTVLPDPEPYAVFLAFGDSALNFELRFFIASIDDWVPSVHAVNGGIDAAFKEAGVVIAFPQRDLHLKTSDANVRIERVEPGGGSSSADAASPGTAGPPDPEAGPRGR